MFKRKCSIKFHGWADSWVGNEKIELPLLLALWEVKGGCGWKLDIETSGSDVRKEWIVSVVSRIYVARGWNLKAGKCDGTMEIIPFSFIVPSYTLQNVYEAAKKSLKTANTRRFTW